jgi:hypothetical protein
MGVGLVPDAKAQVKGFSRSANRRAWCSIALQYDPTARNAGLSQKQKGNEQESVANRKDEKLQS